MGVLANHVPSIEQLKPGLIEIIEETAGSKQFFRKIHKVFAMRYWLIEMRISFWRIRHRSAKLGLEH